MARPRSSSSSWCAWCTDAPAGLRLSVQSQVDGVLYRVYRHPLEKNSSVFAAMFSIPQGCAAGDAEGTSDENPIRLDGVPAAELEAMLQILYPVCVTSFFACTSTPADGG
jgi:hypothetical protein